MRLRRENNVSRPVRFKYPLLLFVSFCFIFYIILDFKVNTKLWNVKEVFKVESLTMVSNSSKKYFVDTLGCKMPSFNVVDENILQYISRKPKPKCATAMFTMEGNELVLSINKSELLQSYNISSMDDIDCQYQEFIRNSDGKNTYINKTIPINIYNRTEMFAEFFQITCNVSEHSQTKKFYTDINFTVRSKLGSMKTNAKSSLESKVSVMIIGIDTVSRLNFHRQMNLTSQLLQSSFDAIEMIGYNKVGDNTYPNLVPLLTGLDESELSLACLPQGKSSRYDSCPFIWKRYKENSYKTVFAEDVASLGLFNYLRKGFTIEPTDYYFRPIILQMEKTKPKKKVMNTYQCVSGRRPIDALIGYIKRFIPLFGTMNFFSFFWSAASTHDYFSAAYTIDEDIYNLLLILNKTNVLNKTVLFLMSDHGIRWGSFRKTYQGMMEERQPLLSIVLPKWFKQKYPTATSNLRQNMHKLTTHFDLYATLLDLNNLSSITTQEIRSRSMELLDSEILPRSISLFLAIPKTRTCEMAGIAAHWCTCYEKYSVSTNDARVQRVARFVVKSINEKLKQYPQCRTLYLNSIFEANIGKSNIKILNLATRNIFSDITVRIQAKPGLGEFEATVRVSDNSIEMTGTISRTNLYGRQSYCVDDYRLKIFCYCDR